jgi:hypothetical protein
VKKSSFRLKRQILTAVSILLAIPFFLSACAPGISDEEKNDVYRLIEWNLYYARTEDLNGYMWTLHPDSPVYRETENQMAFLFSEYDLLYNIEEWEILSINPQSAHVRVVQTTRKLAGPDPFRDNRLEAVHTLRKDAEGNWKIFTTEIREESLEYLE